MLSSYIIIYRFESKSRSANLTLTSSKRFTDPPDFHHFRLSCQIIDSINTGTFQTSYMSVQTNQVLRWYGQAPFHRSFFSFFHITSVAFNTSVRSVNKFKWFPIKTRAERPRASSGMIVPFVAVSIVNLSKPSLPTRARFNLVIDFHWCGWIYSQCSLVHRLSCFHLLERNHGL